MAVKKGDFIELEYSGLLEDGTEFDKSQKPMVICLGEQHMLSGLEKSLEGKEVGHSYEIKLSPEEGFGKRDSRLIRLIPLGKFIRENINPMPGLEVSIDGVLAVVKSVNGGRVLVDMNHPLAGKNLRYKIRINRIVTDDSEKVRAIIAIRTGIEDVNVSIDGSKCRVSTKNEIPEDIAEKLKDEIKRHTKISEVEFETASKAKDGK